MPHEANVKSYIVVERQVGATFKITTWVGKQRRFVVWVSPSLYSLAPVSSTRVGPDSFTITWTGWNSSVTPSLTVPRHEIAETVRDIFDSGEYAKAIT